MIDTVLNLLFRCPHRRLTRPLSAIAKSGVPQKQTYVVCLDCGKQFAYDIQKMKIGKAIDPSDEHSVVPPEAASKPRSSKLAWLAAAVPLGMLIGSSLKTKRPAKTGDTPANRPATPVAPRRD
jgi:hypothetical protein